MVSDIDFDNWNYEKKGIHNCKIQKYYHEREIWWCSLGINIGLEQNGSGDLYRRPVLIIKGLSLNTCLIVPITSSRAKHFLRIHIGVVDGKEASVIISQLRVIDIKRLLTKICYLEKGKFELVRKSVKDIL